MSYFCAFIVMCGASLLAGGVGHAASMIPIARSPIPIVGIILGQLVVYGVVQRVVATTIADLAARPVSTMRLAPPWVSLSVEWLADPAPRWLLLFALPSGAGVWLGQPLLWSGGIATALWGIGLLYTLTLILAALHPDRADQLTRPLDLTNDAAANPGPRTAETGNK